MPSSSRPCLSLLLLATSAMATSACHAFQPPPPLPPQEMIVRVTAGEGEPLSGVAVRPTAGSPGTTDAHGVATITLAGEEGTKVDLSIACPEGYAAPPSVTHVTVRRASRVPELTIPCKPFEHAVVIAFKTTGAPNVPILYLGRELARTDDAGFALVELEPKVGETLAFTLDTSEARFRFLRPQNPERTVLVPEGEEAFTIEQKFVEEKPVAKRIAAKKTVVAKDLNAQ